MNAGPNSTTFTLAPILFPTQLRETAGGFAAGVAKLGATLGVFLLPILKEKLGVPSVLGIVSAVSLLGLVVTLSLRREDRVASLKKDTEGKNSFGRVRRGSAGLNKLAKQLEGGAAVCSGPRSGLRSLGRLVQ